MEAALLHIWFSIFPVVDLTCEILTVAVTRWPGKSVRRGHLLVQRVWGTRGSHVPERHNVLHLYSWHCHKHRLPGLVPPLSHPCHPCHPRHLSLIHSLQRSELKLESLCWLLGGQHTSGLQAYASCCSHSSFGKLNLTFRCSDVFGFNHFQRELSDDFMYSSTSPMHNREPH